MAASTTRGRGLVAIVDGVLDVVLGSGGTVAAGPDVLVVVIAGREVVVGLGLVVVAVGSALEVVVLLSALAVVELVGLSIGTVPTCPRLSVDTSTAGLSPCAAHPAIPKVTTSATRRVRFTFRGSAPPR
jgi:hypothetical protein